ncbi:MAG: phasin family protein [Xanthomonadales bacterium]|nr:phasin family protein [Xanthomonadales bacterium]
MAKTNLNKKVQASASAVGNIAEPVLESARDIWLAGLGAVSIAQKESGKLTERGAKLFEQLVAEGSKLESTTRRTAESKVDSVRDDVEGRVVSLRRQARENWDRLETVFEDRVARVLARLGVPSAEDVRRLTDEVTRLNARVKELSRAKAATPRTSVGEPMVFHLLPKGDDWAVRREGEDRDLSVHGTKNEALEAARGIAQAKEPSRLVVHRADGTIQTSYSYGDDA